MSPVDKRGGPWTRHGFAVPGVTVHGDGRPTVVRCGGPNVCQKCRFDADRLRAVARREGMRFSAHEALRLKDELVERRLTLGLGQADVAERMSVPVDRLAELERYDSNPTLRELQKWIGALDLRWMIRLEESC